MTKVISLLKQFVKTKGSDCFFNYKDNKAKLEENMTLLKDYDNLQLIPKTWRSVIYMRKS